MDLSRRETLLAMAAAGAWTAWPDGAIAAATGEGMYGLIGQMMAVPGKRDALVAILAEGTADMPGCISYVVALDAKDADAIWITEVWTDKASHAASLGLPAVKAAIAKGRPLIAGFRTHVETIPVAGTRSAKA
jgi:quinol monooxygenase YgiN